MKVELTPDAIRWVKAEIAAGTFPTPEDAVRHAVDQLRLNGLRSTLDAAVAEGGSSTTADVIEAIERYLRERRTLENLEMDGLSSPKRTPQQAAERMLARRKFHPLPEGTTIRDLMTYGRA